MMITRHHFTVHFYFFHTYSIHDIRWMLESQFNEYFSTVKVLSDHEIMDDEELNIDEVCLFVFVVFFFFDTYFMCVIEKYTYLFAYVQHTKFKYLCILCAHE
jgi:hypothetical protein